VAKRSGAEGAGTLRVERQFTVSAPLDRAWEELLDNDAVARCVPGGELTAAAGEPVFTGELTVGDNGSAIRALGTLRPIDADADEHTATLRLQGRQVAGPARGAGLIRARLGSEGDGTRVDLSADVTVAGAGGAAEAVEVGAQRLLDAFAERLGEQMAERARSAPAPAAAGARAEAPPPEPEPARAEPPSSLGLGMPGVLTGAPARSGLVLLALALLRVVLGRRPKRVKVSFELKW
jgi:carbon monoxide dehydrogenase subunit G